MPGSDLFLQTIDAVYASGVDSARLPQALEATSRLLGAAGAILEVIDKPAKRPVEFCSVGLPDVARVPYIEQFAALNPRIPFALRQRAGAVIFDRQILDEPKMERDPFYADFLPHMDLRYFAAAIFEHTSEKLAAVHVQRTRKQGHVDKREIALMHRLCPHYQRAHDMAQRLRTAANHGKAFEDAIGWLTDGIALLRADGSIVYVNAAMSVFAESGNGIRIVGRCLEFTELRARDCFNAALGAIARLGDPSLDARQTDFSVPRDHGMPALIASVRPLVGTKGTISQEGVILLLLRDPLWRNVATTRMLQDVFSLTKAEAHLAQALCNGETTRAYASARHVSLNTVYSHLKQIRQKTGCKSVPELVRKFGEWNVPLRLS
jgi:DNA-binding CsgD family transcriptional regulator